MVGLFLWNAASEIAVFMSLFTKQRAAGVLANFNESSNYLRLTKHLLKIFSRQNVALIFLDILILFSTTCCGPVKREGERERERFRDRGGEGEREIGVH